jgi:hypothetical protein
VLKLSTTAFNDASLCLKKYEYRWIHNLIAKPSGVSQPMRRGIWIHRALEVFDQGGDWQRALLECRHWAVERGVEEEKASEVFAECVLLVQGYIDFWKDDTWEFVSSEERLVHQLNADLTLSATLDLLVKWRGGFWLVERKSTGDIPNASWRTVDPQTMIQFALCHLSEKYNVQGVIFDYILTKPAAVPRIKKDGKLYANTSPTTSVAWEQAVRQEQVALRPMDSWLDRRSEFVRDGLWYQRYPVFKFDAAVKSTFDDLSGIVDRLRRAEAAGVYSRLNYLPICKRMCTYSSLCAHEYSTGHPAELLRRDNFDLDTGEREGRPIPGDEADEFAG